MPSPVSGVSPRSNEEVIARLERHAQADGDGDMLWLIERVRALLVEREDQDQRIDALLARAVAAEARAEKAEAKLDQPCGSCHPCNNWSDETWRRAGRKPPHVYEWDELRAKVAAVRERLEQLAEMHATVTDHTGERGCMHCDTVELPCDTHGVASLALAALAAASPGDEETTE